jgi:hypothetical protein
MDPNVHTFIRLSLVSSLLLASSQVEKNKHEAGEEHQVSKWLGYEEG